MLYFSTLLVSVLLTVLMVPLLSKLAVCYDLVDKPDSRKVHSHPIPRIGGVAMALGAFVPIVYWLDGEQFVVAWLFGGAVLVVFGLLDDVYNLRPHWKLLGQFIAASIVIFYGGLKITTLGMLLPDDLLLPVWIGILLTYLAIVGVTNAINLADGLDGLAGGISLLIISCIGYLAYMDGNNDIRLISLALGGAIFGFLRYNTYPATIFMGDSGSQFLGFSAVTLSLNLTQGSTALSPILPLIILGFPVLDTLTVMTGRIRNGRSPFIADRTHFHHSLLELGLYHTESVLTIYIIQVTLIVSAFVFRFYSDWLLLIGYLVFSGAVSLVFYYSRRKNWQPKDLAPLNRVKDILKWLRYRTCVVKYLFWSMKGGFIFILVFTAMLTGRISFYVTITSVATIIILLISTRYFPQRQRELLRAALYLFIPAIIYLGDSFFPDISEGISIRLYNMSFAVLAVLTILVSKLTRRKKGFKSTPLDFLILFIVLIAPNLPVSNHVDYRMGMIAGKVIICYFSCEVFMAELRNNYRRVIAGTVAVLVILAVQGIR